MQTDCLQQTPAAIIAAAQDLFAALVGLPFAERVEAINGIREALHAHSPFKAEPVDCVRWVPATAVAANDYNPNSVAPAEMRLLELSVLEDGYTQPIVSWRSEDSYEVVDGFHRNRVGQESAVIRNRIHGYLPLVVINDDRLDRGDRIASTIRHNRARGKHAVTAMSDIVVELKRRNWTDEKIGKQLGMDPDEVLRLSQISGLAEAFANTDFSRSWDIGFEGDIGEVTFEDAEEEEVTNGKDRIYHTWEHWECYPAGFYETKKDGLTDEECKEAYRAFLANLPTFRAALERVLTEWPRSCEHYLTNESMNRIAWLGQASACLAIGLPSRYRPGYFLLSETEQRAADDLALEYLNRWLADHARPSVDLEGAGVRAQVNLY